MPQEPLRLDGYQPLELADKDSITRCLAADPPTTSELTFTNLFMWRHHYRPVWRKQGEQLLIALQPADQHPPFGLPPVGPGDLTAAALALMADLARAGAAPRLCRVGAAALGRMDPGRIKARLDRDQSDYVYAVEDLVKLPGNRFHRKKNHLNRFLKTQPHAYRPLDEGLVAAVLDMQQDWCALRHCHLEPGLSAEDQAIYEALSHFGRLDYRGGAILIEGRVEAFSLGEALNPQTAVIHIEKANPEVPGLYAAINQRFAAEAWAGMAWINREQDLGIEGLRQAKESYNPRHLVDKYELTPA
ncbi:MAG: DUF2156 domain-containing protein [Thermodesulfobacteriota bacterium]